MIQFCNWLSQTSASLAIQTHDWVIPTLQSIHILAIAVILTSVFMIALRVLGWAGEDQTLLETFGRFGRPLSAALVVAAVTGTFQLLGEPARELLSFSFWLKMSLLVVATMTAIGLHVSIRKNENHWQQVVVHRWSVKAFTVVTVLTWTVILVLGRLIAYDSIWGSLSRVPKD
jgi:hypothetical protein